MKFRLQYGLIYSEIKRGDINLRNFIIIYGIFTVNAVASIFNPVTTINSRTNYKNSFSLSRSPLQNLNSTFLTASLNFGLLERIEIGTVPVFYLTSEHRHNYMLKYNFYRSSNIDWSLVYGKSSYRVKLNSKNEELQMTAIQLALNLHLPEQQWAIGTSINQSCGYLNSKNLYLLYASYHCVTESGVDFQYKIFEDKWITLGVGRMRKFGISPFEPLVTGFGFAYTQFFKNKFLSRPSLGVYNYDRGNITFLISSTFYENL